MGIELTFRPMQKQDVHEVSLIERLCFRSPWSEKMIAGELKNRVAHYYVAETSEKEIIGYLGMWIMFEEAHITNIAVAPSYRRNGVAQRLMLHGMQQALLSGATQMTLEVREHNSGAQALYFGLDFVSAGKRKRYYSDTGEDALILWNTDIQNTMKRLHA
ncbi:ribosomal protein S18-alanine N-acetyltransferase [Christensenellaceae bacterium OttesenSCG-928-L17]|nr:ribosomal protein S18-alanine N-acetyltransferase [Christensenellaceae bacterium OttesenSCG-928-L17]